MAGFARLQVGDKSNTKVDARRDNSSLEWKVKTYESGEWERLIHPTLLIAEFLNYHKSNRSLSVECTEIIKGAAKKFQDTGEFNLPLNSSVNSS